MFRGPRAELLRKLAGNIAVVKGKGVVSGRQTREMSRAISPRIIHHAAGSLALCILAEPLLNYVKYLTRARAYPGRRTKRIITSPPQEIQEGRGWEERRRLRGFCRIVSRKSREGEQRERRCWRLPGKQKLASRDFASQRQSLYVI